jgi:3-oxoacyl-[acyl-carrier protein] reductase
VVSFTADLRDRKALVTGGGGGIGLATVEMMARAGATVALNRLPNDDDALAHVERLRAEGLSVIDAPGDVSSGQGAQAMVDAALDALGGLDYLVNNAATFVTSEPIPMADLDAIDEAFWDAILSTNLVGPFRCARAAAKALKASNGAVVNVASTAGLGLTGSSIAYGASKAGLINLTQNLARALAPEVRVNAVAPGHVITPWTDRWPKARRDFAINKSLLKKASRPQDIAEVIVFLCAGAGMITGQTIPVEGGYLLG